MLRLALRNVLRHGSRTALTLAAIMSGVAALILTGGFVEDSLIQLREATIHSQVGHLQVFKAGYNAQGSRAPYQYMIDDPQHVVDLVKALSQVENVMRRLSFAAVLNNGRADIPIVGVGVEPEAETALGSSISIIAGRQLTGKDGYGILLGEGVAVASRLKPGDRAGLLVGAAEGVLNNLEFEVVGVFRSFSKDYDDRAVRIPLPAAQELLDIKAANSIVVLLKDTESTGQVAALLEKRLDVHRYELKTWDQLADFYEKTSALYRRQFVVLQVIVLIAVLLSVVNSVNITVFERTGEFGTLMALGNRSGKIFRLAVTENVLLGLAGAAGGVLLGVALAGGISIAGIPMPPPPNSNRGYVALIRVVPSVVAGAFLVGFLGTVAGALLPARRAARMPVIDALRQNQ